MPNLSENGYKPAPESGFLARAFGPRPINKAIFITNLKRYWPGAALMLLVYLVYALTMFADISGSYYRNTLWTPKPEYISDDASVLFGIFAFISGLVASMLCFHYLMNQRETIMSHSLPIKRESHLLSAVASGAVLLGAPIVAGGLLFFSIYALTGLYYPLAALHWTIANLSIAFFAFCIGAFFAMLTGNSIAHGILTLIFINLPLMVEAVFGSYCERFLFGYVMREPATLYINPLYYIINYFSEGSERYSAGLLPDFWPPVLFLLVGIAFVALAALLYRRRNLETAGDIISLRQVRPFLRYGVALGVAFFFGVIYNGVSYGETYAPAWEIFFSIIGGAIGFFIAEMFIRRTIHVFKRHYMGAIGFALVFVAVFLSIYHDVPGYGRMKLDAGAIDYIVINDIKPRVRQSIKGEPLSFFGTISDLDIDDPGGYLDGRRMGTNYRAKGAVPRGIAQQIIERDRSVLRGAYAQTAVEFQHFLAENSLYFGNEQQVRARADGSGSYSYRRIPIIARYTDGRIVERSYYVRLYTKNALHPAETPELIFADYMHSIRYLAMAADRKFLLDCAARAQYIQLDFPAHVVENHMPGKQGTERMILNPGQWNGLFEAYERDGLQQGGKGIINSYGDYYDRWVGDATMFVTAEIMMDDGYNVSVRIGTDDTGAAMWIVQQGYISIDILGD